MRAGILLWIGVGLASAGVCDFALNEEQNCATCVAKDPSCLFCGDGSCKSERAASRSAEKCCDSTRGKPCFTASSLDRTCPSLRNTTSRDSRKVDSLACIATRSYGSGTAPTNGNTLTITSAQETGEYCTINSVVAASMYTATSSVATDYITVTTNTNAVVAEGTTPVPFTAPSSGTYRLHYHLSSSCNDAPGNYRTSRLSNTVACTASYAYGSATAPTTYLQEVVIASNQEPDEYATISNCIAATPYQARTSVQTDYITVRAHPSQTVIAAGIQPVTFTPPTTGTYTLHYHLNSNCGTTPSSYRQSSIVNYRATCTASTGYGSVNAPKGGNSAEITQRQETGEYATVVGAGGGAIFAARSSVTTDYLTVRVNSPTGTVVHAGQQPVLFAAFQTPTTYYIHYHLSANCDTASGVYRTSSVENTRRECFGNQGYGQIVAPIAGTTVITNKQHTGDWALVTDIIAGQEYVVSSDHAGDYITVTAQAVEGQVIAAGVTPLAFTIEAGGTAYIHFFNSDTCGNDAVSRTTSVTNTPSACEGSYQWPSGNVGLPTNGNTVVISNDNYYGDYAILTGAVSGARYSIASTKASYVSVRSDSRTGTLVTAGWAPLNFLANSGTSYYAAFHADTDCTSPWDSFGTSVTHISGIAKE